MWTDIFDYIPKDIDDNWQRMFMDIFARNEYNTHILYTHLKNIHDGNETGIHPDENNIFRCFQKTKYKDLKCVITGHDPYTHRQFADGLCFSIPLKAKGGMNLYPSWAQKKDGSIGMSLNVILNERIREELASFIPSGLEQKKGSRYSLEDIMSCVHSNGSTKEEIICDINTEKSYITLNPEIDEYMKNNPKSNPLKTLNTQLQKYVAGLPNIPTKYKDVQLNPNTGRYMAKSGNLGNWAQNGVLLLNRALTGKRCGKRFFDTWGWFTENVVWKIAESRVKDGCAFIFFGKNWDTFFQYFEEVFSSEYNYIIKNFAHPSAEMKYDNFTYSGIFSYIIDQLNSYKSGGQPYTLETLFPIIF